MPHRVRPFLMLQGKAEEAMKLYVSLFADGAILDIVRYGPGQAGRRGPS
jgi:predicted 3-demethylubiquinone-9 3-methyltransferase (glyoxalase superfamily)